MLYIITILVTYIYKKDRKGVYKKEEKGGENEGNEGYFEIF